MKRVKLIVAYDGTAYCGWQIQKNGITVEEVLNTHLSRLLGEDIHVTGASRTDAGVHALGNVAVFDTNTKIPGEKISYALNQSLPEDIRIRGSKEVEPDFHPRYHNSVKTYEYRIYNSPFEMPLCRGNTYFFHRKLDTEKMQAAADYLLGEHDFAAFCSSHAQVRETTRTIYRARVLTEEEQPAGEETGGRLIRFQISGNGFLYNMVRIIAGTLIEVGLSKYPPEHMKEILEGRDREQAGACAPAKGLTLLGIRYEQTLADQLLVCNERMHYSLVQKEIPRKHEACLIIFRCEKELLADLIVRMTKKSFRLGAKRFYVRHMETPVLAGELAPSRRNRYEGGEFFTAGDFRYVLDHEIWQMDRDLRADPPGQPDPLLVLPLKKEEVPLFCGMYQKCFFGMPCTMQLSEEQARDLVWNGQECTKREQAYLVWQEHVPVGLLILKKAAWDPDGLLISAMGVEGKYRKKGIGKKLLTWTANKAVALGKKRVTLEVSSKNKRALSLYEQNGFFRIRSGESRWYRCDDRADRRRIPENSEKS